MIKSKGHGDLSQNRKRRNHETSAASAINFKNLNCRENTKTVKGSVGIGGVSMPSKLTLVSGRQVASLTEDAFYDASDLAAMFQGDLFRRPLYHDAAQILCA